MSVLSRPNGRTGGNAGGDARAGARRPSSPRTIAFDLLTSVLDRQQPLDEAFERHPGVARLDGRDRAFARHLSATTLRRLGQIDAMIDHALARPLPARAALVRHILRLGVCQLVFLATPAHAAVDSSVDLCRQRGHLAHASFVNAVLRRLAGEAAALAAGQDAARLNTPTWLWQSWSAAYGEERCRAIAAAHLQEAPLDLTPRDNADASLLARLGATRLPTGTLRSVAHGPIPELPGFAEGAWWVQDAAAAIPATFLGPVQGQSIADLCAAPGGKTAQLAQTGARVIAVDRSPARLARLNDNRRRLGLEAASVCADVATWQPEAPVAGILLDVPCSATGTIRRHPDIAWLKSAAEVASLTSIQERLLRHALTLLQPGGRLVYCVCSLQPEEGPGVVNTVLASRPDIEREPIDASDVHGLTELLTADGDLRVLPCHLAELGGMDGFYAARLRLRPPLAVP